MNVRSYRSLLSNSISPISEQKQNTYQMNSHKSARARLEIRGKSNQALHRYRPINTGLLPICKFILKYLGRIIARIHCCKV